MAVEIRMSASSSMRWSALDRSADGLQRSVCASFPISASVDRGLGSDSLASLSDCI